MSQTTTTSPVTVVLVHGGFADGSSWAGVIERLHGGRPGHGGGEPVAGHLVDSAYVASVFDQIPGPVLAVGPSNLCLRAVLTSGGCGRSRARPRSGSRSGLSAPWSGP
jgi:hypothetical protein